MSRPNFYFSTLKKVIVAFATVFDEIEVLDDFDRPYMVPLVFSQKEKFVEAFSAGENMNDTDFDLTFPRMGFELTGINFAPERHVNPLNRMNDEMENGTEIETYNRIPYDITFDLYIGARKLEDSLKILEQIIPFFTPELTVTIKDREEFKLETNIPIVLNSTSVQIDYEGSFDTRRTILWNLNFTCKAYFYPNFQSSRRIKQTILNFGEKDFERIFSKFTSTVTPMTADIDDPHTIVDTVERIYDNE